ncbi:hypothetical protein MHB42_09730 [Lysinibacillus sp. FSL K6-0232]|uniref:hypothetical protein n=1 Tax=Lysinibacillus sp. FSL K6-0232 TaxID=2921425 RepID=UPI0030FB05A5
MQEEVEVMQEEVEKVDAEGSEETESLEERVAKMQEENQKLLERLEEQQVQAEKNNLIATLNAEGLSHFVGLFDLTTTEERVAFLKNAVNSILVANAYQPKQQAKQEAYEQAINDGDVNSAIKFKLSKFFGK